MVRDFAWYHGALIAASRYVMRETEGMFQSIYMDIKEYLDIGGSVVRLCVMRNGKMYHSFRRWFKNKDFDSMYKRDISPELYCQEVLMTEVFDLYVSILLKEDIDPVLFIREYKKIKGGIITMFKEHDIKWSPVMLKSRCPSEQELMADYHRNILYNTLEGSNHSAATLDHFFHVPYTKWEGQV